MQALGQRQAAVQPGQADDTAVAPPPLPSSLLAATSAAVPSHGMTQTGGEQISPDADCADNATENAAPQVDESESDWQSTSAYRGYMQTQLKSGCGNSAPPIPGVTDDASALAAREPVSDERNLVERNSCYQENQANKDLMEAPQYQLLNRDGLGDRTPRRSQPERQKSQELPFENAGNAFAEGTVCHEEKMDHQETEEEHLVIREREAGDYFGDPTPRMSRLTTLLAAQSASKLLGKRTQRGLQDDQSPIAPKSAITTKSSGQDQLWDVSDQPALSDACRCWRPSTAQAQNDVLHNDWDDTLEPVMSKLVDLTIDQQCTKGCHVVPKYEQLHADAANVLEPVVRKLEDMQMNPWRAEMPTADTGDEHKDTDSPNPLQ
ncbi:uncharacterized protein LOC119464511 isoform X1 [Dermacentor silvarum]|uniref:uncharacterized protein LOC119464511 isoform X1 n=1 Tax=Dermacentor silvarum TaxID=543639 RepID=UPI0021008333|nr:uncharacterized protein LOC119464511 isoform X1 [Dermacentor silvarum]